MTEIYHTDETNKLRFLLGRYVNRPLIIMGVNPSKASLQKDDMTSTKVARFANKLGFDGWILCNIYPRRATLIENLPNRRSLKTHQENVEEIQWLLGQIDQPTIWAAWGNLVNAKPYLKVCLKEIVDGTGAFQPQWIHLGGKTKEGHPRHPSRMGYKVPVNSFLVEEYVKALFDK